MIAAAAFIAFSLGVGSYYLFHRIRLGKFETLAADILRQAELQAEATLNKGKLELNELKLAMSKDFETAWQSEKKKLAREEERLQQREDKLEQRLSANEKKEATLVLIKENVEKERILAAEILHRYTTELEKTAGFTSEEAKAHLISKLEQEIKADHARFIKQSYEQAVLQSETEASRIIATAIQRMASSTTSEITACTVSLPSEDMKGRIIGREGRNIRAFEKATGVTLVMDDTPQAVVISGFDPVRRNIAKIALTDLIQDGRIHTTSIEETVEKATLTSTKQIQHFGEDAAFRVGIFDLHPEMLMLLGKLKFRYSVGQNVLDHSIEVANLMGIMAAELGIDVALSKRIGLLHDIGKAVSHEVQGTHALIGRDLALKYGESASCANGIGCHHFEIEPTTIEASLCSAADTVSASRPGARIEAAHEYVRRLKKMEDLALEFPGVEKAYALQAGRELRVIVFPDHLNDDELLLLAKSLTQKIQKELTYPGKIKVTLLREKRVVDYAM
jgi:ribonuclease Y